MEWGVNLWIKSIDVHFKRPPLNRQPCFPVDVLRI